MADLYAAPSTETWKQEGKYRTKFLNYKGFVDRIPILKAILNANADAVTASWHTEGRKAKELAELLDKWRGTGKETFKLIMNNMTKIAKIGGDSYAEIIYDTADGFEGEIPVDCVILPSDKVTQIIEKGRIKKYEFYDATEWEPEEILHLAYNPIGAMTHGQSVIEPMNNILLDIEQLLDTGSKIFERYIKPTNVIYMDTDSTTEMQKLVDEWKATMNVADADLFVPKGIVDKVERVSVPQGSTLDPAHWHRVLLDHVIMGSRVPELALGTGSVNSEESARMQFMGFRQMVRWDQKWLEENLRAQIFSQIFVDDVPNIKFSFAAEGQEERWQRLMESFVNMSGSTLPDDVKYPALAKLMIEMGLIEDV